MNKPTHPESNTRRKILYWAAGTLSALLFWRLSKPVKKENNTVKMLTEDGRLVEVDKRFLKEKGRKIQPDEIHSWIKNRN